MLDWKRPSEYAFTELLSAAQWAWEYLRRNPRYREEWQAFHATWQELEGCYGSPPNRDFNRWKRDPRAWVSVVECEGSDCRIDADKVLIECALGARWGFYKFPPDPADDDPAGEGRLTWRPYQIEPRLLQAGEDSGEHLPGEVRIAFDLRLPLPAQLASAKRQLQIEQRAQVRSGLIEAPHISAHRERLCRLLRLLDGIEAGVDSEQLAAQLYVGATESLLEDKATAIDLRDHDYLRLLLLD